MLMSVEMGRVADGSAGRIIKLVLGVQFPLAPQK